MKRVGWYVLSLTMLFASFLQFRDAYVGLEPLHLTHSHRVMSVTSLFAEEFPESGYLSIEEGYVIPSYSIGGGELVTSTSSAYLVSKNGLAYWLENRSDGSLNGVPDSNLFLTFDDSQIHQFWPGSDLESANVHPFSLPPVQTIVAGKKETWNTSLPTGDSQEFYTAHVLRLERPFAPWWVLFNSSLGCLILSSSVRLARYGHIEPAEKSEANSISEAQPAD